MMTISRSIRRRYLSTSGKAPRWRAPIATLAIGVVLAGISAAPALATEVGSLSVTLSSTSTNATQVKYSASFVSTHALTANSSKITLTGPAGTKFPASSSDYAVEDPRTHQSGNGGTPTVSVGENEVTITTSIGANAGDHFVVIVDGVSNTSTEGSQNVGIATSADPTTANQAIDFTAPTSIGSASVALSSTSTTATNVTYTASFKPTNALTGSYSTVTLTAPTGTTFPSSGCGNYTVADTRTHQSYTCESATLSAVGGSLTNNRATIGIYYYSESAGDSMVVTVNGVSNTSTEGSQDVSVSTSSDPAPFEQKINFTAPTSVGSASVTLTSTSTTATEVSYKASFTATHALTANYSTITLTAPAGTTFPSSGCVYTVTDETTGQSDTCDPAKVSEGGNSATITMNSYGASAGNSLVVTVYGVSNTSTKGSQNVSVSTSSDPASVTPLIDFTAPSSVGSASVSLSSTSATATDVTYTASFVPTNSLTGSYSTITLIAPEGTTFPSSGCVYTVTDETTGQSYTCETAKVSAEGNSVTIGMYYYSASAGNNMQVTVYGVSNTSKTGSQNVNISTSSDPAPVSKAVNFTAPTSVLYPAVSLSSTSTNATQVTYIASFQPKSSLTGGYSTITLTAPAGTTFPTSCGDYNVTNVTTGASNGCETPTVSGGGNSVTIATNSVSAVGGNNRVQVTVYGVTNTSTEGKQNVSISTSSDPTPVSEATGFTAPTSVSDANIYVGSTDSTSVNATQVTYTATFQPKNGLTGNHSTITLTAPTGTTFPSSGCNYTVRNETTGASYTCETPTVSGGGNSVTIGTYAVSAAGFGTNRLRVTVNGVSNTSVIGIQNMSISTSSDPTPVNQAVNFTAPSSVGSAVISPSSTSTDATQVTYTTSFIPESNLTGGYSTITLTAPAGTTFPTSCGDYNVTNVTTGASNGCETPTVTGGGSTVTIATNSVSSTGYVNRVRVTVNGVSNTSTTGSQDVSVSTSSDPTPVNQAVNFTAPTSVGSANVSLSSAAEGATQVTYTASFIPKNSMTGNSSTITLTAPEGTKFPTSGCVYTVTNVTTGASYTCETPTVSGGSNSVTIGTYAVSAVGNTQRVQVTVYGVTNTSTKGSQDVSVSTSSDPTPVNQAVNFTAPTSVGSALVSLSSTSVSATGVTYTDSFIATHALATQRSTVTLAAPTGTTLPTSNCSYTFYDNTTLTGGGCPTVAVSGTSVTITANTEVAAGDEVEVTVNGVSNTSTVGAQNVGISTSSDSATVNRSIKFTAETGVQSGALGLNNPTPSATGVTYTTNFTATNGLTAGYSTVTFTAPSGTVLPTAYYEYEVEDVTTKANAYSDSTPTLTGTNSVTFVVNTNVAAGDQVTFRIKNVTNDGTAGAQEAKFSTSSDPLAVSLPFTLS
jgi:hypothetical protein